MAVAADTFVEASDTALTSHTPTGPDAGAGWVAALGSPLATVRAATDDVIDGQTGNANRFRMTTDLGSDLMDVRADITANGSGTRFPGVAARVPTGGGAVGIEFLYDFSVNRWFLDDDTGTTAELSEAWPGGVVDMRILIPGDGKVYGFGNDVLKVQITSNVKTGNNFGGIVLGNFSGTAGVIVADNFRAASAVIVTLGLVVETDSAQAVTSAKSVAIGQVTETDSALAVTTPKSVALGLVAETDTALALTHAKATTLGLVTETDSSLPVTITRLLTLGPALETDTAQTLTTSNALALGLVSETDTALPLTLDRSYTIGLVTESDLAQALTWAKSAALGLVVETSTVFALTTTGGLVVTIIEPTRTQLLSNGRTKTELLDPTRTKTELLDVGATRTLILT